MYLAGLTGCGMRYGIDLWSGVDTRKDCDWRARDCPQGGSRRCGGARAARVVPGVGRVFIPRPGVHIRPATAARSNPP